MKREIPATGSAYYPPRARWYGRFRYPWIRLRSELGLERRIQPASISVTALVLCLLLPGYAFAAFGRKSLSRLIAGTYGLAAAVFVMGLGIGTAHFSLAGEEYRFRPAYIAFGLMVAMHAVSVTHLLLHFLTDLRFTRQVACGFAVTAVLLIAVYFPTLHAVDAHLVILLQIRGQVVFVSRLANPRLVRRGQWVAYRIGREHRGGVVIHGGYALGEVLGMPGDQVQFGPESFAINGAMRKRPEHMLASGVVTVPENHWFIWPDLGISIHGVAEETVVEAMTRLAVVDYDQFVGKPFGRWFLRKQVMP